MKYYTTQIYKDLFQPFNILLIIPRKSLWLFIELLTSPVSSKMKNHHSLYFSLSKVYQKRAILRELWELIDWLLVFSRQYFWYLPGEKKLTNIYSLLIKGGTGLMSDYWIVFSLEIKIGDVAWLSMRQPSIKFRLKLNLYRSHYGLQIWIVHIIIKAVKDKIRCLTGTVWIVTVCSTDLSFPECLDSDNLFNWSLFSSCN